MSGCFAWARCCRWFLAHSLGSMCAYACMWVCGEGEREKAGGGERLTKPKIECSPSICHASMCINQRRKILFLKTLKLMATNNM